MLIVHVIVDLTPGGAELMLKRLIAVHAADGAFRHHVISLRTKATVGPMIEALGVPVETLGMRGVLSFPIALLKLTRRLRALKPDVVQGWMYHGDFLGGLAARLAGNACVLWSVRATHIPSGVGTSPITAKLRHACAALSRWLPSRIVYVAHAARAAHEALGYEPSRGLVIPNGYAIPPHPATPGSRALVRERLGLAPDTILIGSAGRFNALKDYRSFIRAGAALAADLPQAQFLLMGRGLDADNTELREWLEESGEASRFLLLGPQEDLTELLSGLDIFCLHSLSEGFPNVVAEAMALGVPCVVTDVGDSRLLVGKTGRVVPAADPAALRDALRDLVSAGEEVREQLGAAARRRIKEQFSMEAVADRFSDLYRSCWR